MVRRGDERSGPRAFDRSAGEGVAGLLFGAWFTYDPAGAAHDATTQHWFTLQADLSTAANGSVVVPIYSTLSGTLDETPGRTTIRVGQGTLTFDGCASGTFAYQFDATEKLAHIADLAAH